jgi:hypothetical protein
MTLKPPGDMGVLVLPRDILYTENMRFAVCVDNTDYQGSLIVRKIYEVLPDKEAAKDDLLRVIDESGEDYLYPCRQFIVVELPAEVERALTAV